MNAPAAFSDVLDGPVDERVTPSVVRCGADFVNWYLIEEQSRLTLVDAGLYGQWELLERLLAQLGRGVDDVEAVVLTHVHPDHIGLAARLQQRRAVPVYVHRLDAPAATSWIRQRLPPRGIPLHLPRSAFVRAYDTRWRQRGILRPTRLTHVRPVEDATSLDVPGRLQLHWVGGHTRGHVALLNGDRSVAFTGDSLVSVDMRTGALDGPQAMPDQWNADPEQARNALNILSRHDAAAVAPGHGPAVSMSLAEATRQAATRLDR